MSTLAQIRQAVAAAIDTARGVDGWRESPLPYGQFGARESAARLDRAYAVGVPDTTAQVGRQKLSEGALVETRVAIAWRVNLAALDQITGYDGGLAQEAELVKAVRDITTLQLRLISATRTVDAEGWMGGELVFSIWHRLALN